MRGFSTRFGTVSGAAAAMLGLAAFIDIAGAEPDSFSVRWAVFAVPPKGDRLMIAVRDSGSQAQQSVTVVHNDASARVTIARKAVHRPAAPDTHAPMHTVPGESGRGHNTILDGCDPAFSPVTTPDGANVAGRCLASLRRLQHLAARR
ncbi:MAG: hypothetical protein H3C55_00330 [Pseudorhodoplanes sp.]|nr:hypothetical protein [Pseudorhodoplanes sp.]MBW7947783.1 hypothetical protein [Pseudorhodoplanes sp.]GIK79500.1 MAG: hypothetical protein BroJett024_06050 [Alphaproteobacteria bacterium]